MAAGPALISLPDDIWERVASFLTLRESCTLASTCRALWVTDLPCVTLSRKKEGATEDDPQWSAQGVLFAVLIRNIISPAFVLLSVVYTVAALAWAADRWTRAQKLDIQIWHGNARQLSKALAGNPPNGLAHLEEVFLSTVSSAAIAVLFLLANCLSVGLQARQVHVHIDRGDMLMGCEIACAWLLTQATNIKVYVPPTRVSNLCYERRTLAAMFSAQVLNAHVNCLDVLGAARGIRHLLLDSPCVLGKNLSASLSVLEQLQTLSLVNVTNLGDEQQRASGALHLTALRNLQSVALDQIVPHSIQLPKSCELHIVQRSPWRAEHMVWDTMLPHLRSVVLYIDNHQMSVVPSCLLNAGSLALALVLVDTFGTAAAPLLHVWRTLSCTAIACMLLCPWTLLGATLIWQPGYCWICASKLSRLLWRPSRPFASATTACRCAALSQLGLDICPVLFLPKLAQLLCPQGKALSELAVFLARKYPEWDGHFSEDGTVSCVCFPLAQSFCSIGAASYNCRCRACDCCLSNADILYSYPPSV